MKFNDLKKLIKECYSEVLKEYSTQSPTFDQQTGDFTNTMKISKSDPQKQQKIQAAQKAKQSYELYEKENQVNEMARIPQLYKIGPNAKDSESKLANHPKVKKMIEFIEVNGPSSINTIAKENSWRQQQLNPMIEPLIDLGILEPAGLRSEPKNPAKPKDTSTKFNDDGEEMFDDNYGDYEDELVGFSDKYDYIPRSDDDNDVNDEEMFDDSSEEEEVPSLDDEIEKTGEVPDDIEAILNDNPFDIGDEEDEDELYEIKQFKYRAGLIK